MTLATTVAGAAARFGDRPAVVAPDGWTLSYAQLEARATAAAAALADRGVGEGDPVALVLPSCPDYVVAYAAAAQLGAVTMGVNPGYTPTERARLLDGARPAAVLATADLAQGLTTDDNVIEVRPGTDAASVLDGLVRQGEVAAPPPPLADPDAPNRPVAVVFTSGTTGAPRGAVFANRQLDAITAADLGARATAWGGGGPLLAATSLAHVGFMTKLPWYLRTGSTIHLLARWRAEDVLTLIGAHAMTSVGGVAPQMALLLRHLDPDRHDVSSVHTIVMGGAASPPALVEEARRRFGASYSIRYSSTESGGIGLGTAFDAEDEEALHTVGRPRPGVEVAIVDPTGTPVATGEVGELCLRSPCTMSGYWQDPAATAAALRDGWLHTGDLARTDERGLVRLAGRAKEMYIRGGYNVYPLEVEAVLGQHPAVAEVAVAPRSDPVMGEVGVAVVVPTRPGTAPDLDALRAHGAGLLAPWKLPEAIVVVDALPLTTMHKVDRAALAALVAGPAAGMGPG